MIPECVCWWSCGLQQCWVGTHTERRLGEREMVRGLEIRWGFMRRRLKERILKWGDEVRERGL